MAYDPAVASFILVGMVGGVALVMNASSGWEITHELVHATDHWTVPVVIRSYGTTAKAKERRSQEAAILHVHGYEAALQRGAGDPVKPGNGPATGDRTVVAIADPTEKIVIAYRLI